MVLPKGNNSEINKEPEKEMENEEVGVRSHKDGDIGAMKLNEFVDKIKYEVDNKINNK